MDNALANVSDGTTNPRNAIAQVESFKKGIYIAKFSMRIGEGIYRLQGSILSENAARNQRSPEVLAKRTEIQEAQHTSPSLRRSFSRHSTQTIGPTR